MAISRTQQVSATANTATITAPTSGDLIVVAAFNASAATAPTLPAGYTQITTNSANVCAMITGYKISNGTETNVGTWTNATAVACIVFRGAGSVGSAAVGASSTSTGATATLTYAALTLKDLGSRSWLVGFGGNKTSAAATAPTGMTLETSVATLVASDTEAVRTTNWTATNVTGNTAIGWQSAVIEIRSPVAFTASVGGASLVVDSQMPSGVGVTSSTSPWTWSFTNTAGTVLYLVVTLDGSGVIPTVTYAGTSMTLLGNSYTGHTGSIFLFRLTLPATGANNFVVTWSSGTQVSIAAAISFTGNATPPDNGGATINGYLSTSTTFPLTVGSLTGNIIVMAAAYGDPAHSTQTGTLSAVLDVNGASYANNMTMQYQSASSGSTATSVTGTTVTSFVCVGIEVRAATTTFPPAVGLYGNMAQLGLAAAAASVVDLTAEGVTDWAKWGQVANTDFIHKSTGGTQISNVTATGATPSLFTNNPTAFSWSDGTPTASYTGTAGSGIGIYINVLNGTYSFTVPADTTLRMLRLYCGLFSDATPQLTAHLSDSSSSDYVDSTMNSGVAVALNGVYTIYYKAASASQTLTLTWKQTNSSGNVNVQAATLALAPATTGGSMFAGAMAAVKLKAQAFVASMATMGGALAKQIGRALPATTSTFAGVITKQLLRPLAASMATMGGVLSKSISKLLAASMATMNATIARLAPRLMAASMAVMNATITKSVLKLLAASMATMAATLTKRVSKLLAASMATFAGVLAAAKSKIQTFAASMATMGGTLAKMTGKSLAASIAAFSGSLVKFLSKSLAASMATFNGALATIRTKMLSLAASMPTMSGAISKRTAHGLAASMAAFAGAMGRFIGAPLIASMATFAGAVTKFTSKTLAASMATFAGTLTTIKSKLMALAASMATFSGSITKRTLHGIPATMATMNATITKTVGKVLTATMATFAGALAGGRSRVATFAASMATMSAALIKQTQKSLVASMATMAVTQIKSAGKVLVASLATMSAAITKSISKSLSASMATMSGALAHGTGKAVVFIASMATMSAALGRSTLKTLVASMATFGATVGKAIAHAIAASMALFRGIWTFILYRLGAPGLATSKATGHPITSKTTRPDVASGTSNFWKATSKNI